MQIVCRAVVTVQGTGGAPNYTYAFVNDSAIRHYLQIIHLSLRNTCRYTTKSNAYDVWVRDAEWLYI
jgi:hypothetical protein